MLTSCSGVPALDVHETELEELLIYDDLFLEYFNAFLALPAFPVRIFYDRLTGNVCDLDGISQDDPDVYGASDLQRETTLFWLRQERLPLFRKSLLYIEYKLTKLLVRPLEDPQPASRYGIRGYSRQTNSVALSTSHGSTGPQQFSAPSVWPEELPVTAGRFPSRVHSTPAAPGYDSDPYRLSLLQQYGDTIMRLCQPPDPQVVDDDLYAAITHSEITVPRFPESPDLQLRIEATAWAEDQRDTRDPTDVVWSNGDRGTDTEDNLTEEEENFVKQHNLTMSTLQQLKEEALSSRAGLGRFLHFLQDTQGIHMFRFWMDCEAFKEQSVDLEVNHSPEDARHLCVHLFRDIQNKYQHHLSPECQEQIRLCQQSRGPSYHALRRSQYDALRRLRSYWIPRFLIHQQKRSPVSLTDHTGVKSDSTSHPSLITDPAIGDGSVTPRMIEGDTIFRPLVDQEGPSSSLSGRMISALKNDAQAGGTFLHYLNRFETPKTTQIFLLWQELNEYGEWGPGQNDSAPCQCQGPAVYPQSSVTRAGESCLHCGNGDPVMGRSDLSEGIQVADLGSTYHLALAALREPWIRFLKYDIAMFLRYCVPLSHNKSQELGSTGYEERKPKPKRLYKENREKGLHFGGSKKVKKRKDPLMVPGFTTGPGHLDQDPNIPLEMLQHKAIYKAYKKLIQETEEPQTMMILEMFHALQCNKEDHKVLGLIQKVLELDAIQNPQLQGLRKHLTSEISKGAIKSSSIEQVTRFLGMLLAVSFNRFWGEMSNRLKEYGVEQSENGGWTRLEPILLAISTKMVMKRLHGRRNDTYHPAQLLPGVDDGDSFHQALEMAAQGWPTPEVLHFLKYLQTHGPPEGLPLLENNLLCCLELRKYKNAHHAMPDRGLLKKKVHVIKERFLLLRENPGLQLSPEHMEAALRDTETAEAAHSDLPSISLFDHLHDRLSDSLLPFWAGFRKAWAARSPASAQRVPLLRVQQMLRKRLALFEVEETPLRTFHLPPVQQNFNKTTPSMVTFSFSMTNGLTLKESGAETTDPLACRRTSNTEDLPSISPSSPDRTPLHVTRDDKE
ncbi:uncharacterized protein RB166_004336 [Leptodactylus fuscus]